MVRRLGLKLGWFKKWGFPQTEASRGRRRKPFHFTLLKRNTEHEHMFLQHVFADKEKGVVNNAVPLTDRWLPQSSKAALLNLSVTNEQLPVNWFVWQQGFFFLFVFYRTTFYSYGYCWNMSDMSCETMWPVINDATVNAAAVEKFFLTVHNATPWWTASSPLIRSVMLSKTSTAKEAWSCITIYFSFWLYDY